MFCFKTDKVTTLDAASEAEKVLLGRPYVNAAVADPVTKLVYVFADEGFGQIPDPGAQVQVSVSISWSCFAALNLRPTSGAALQYIGVYPACRNKLELHNMKALIRKAVLECKLDIKVKSCAACVWIFFGPQGRGFP